MSAVNDRLAAAPECGTPGCSILVVTGGLEVCIRCLCGQIGVTPRQLDYWSRRGWLRPQRQVSRRGTADSGTPHRWDSGELEVARRMGVLIRAGLSPVRAAAFARASWPCEQVAPGVWVEVTLR